MKRILALFSAALLVLAATARSTAQTGDIQQVDLGPISRHTIPVVIAGDAQLAAMAHKAFQSHGRFQRLASGGEYTLTFTALSPAQVRADVAKKGGATTSITASGSGARDALYRAADEVVRQIARLPGYFTSRLAFVSDAATGKDDIYVSDLFLDEARRVTNHSSTILMPRWSPDGTKILYTSFFNSQSADIFQLDLNAGRWSVYANFNGTNMSARHSPDGSRVVMVISPAGGAPNLYIRPAHGNAPPARITSTAEAKSSPCFSPDGQRVVFAQEHGPQLYIMSASGGTPARVGTGTQYAAEPDWCRADPNLIAFTTKVGGVFLVAVHNLATGKTRVIQARDAGGAKISGDFLEPSWLPDGRHVVCTWRTAGQRALYILDTEENSGNRATKISAIRAEHASVWSPR